METPPFKVQSGLIGWAAFGVLLGVYEAYAIKTKKIETLSTALHKLEGVPGGIASVVWGVITVHLFIEPKIKKRIRRR